MKKTNLFLTIALGFTTMYGFAQNSCNTAIQVYAGITTVDTIIGDPPQGMCVNQGTVATKGMWYKYTAAEDITVTISTDLTQNIGGDTRVMIYKGDCDALVCHDGDDDAGVLGNGYLSIVDFPALEGQTYYIVFDNRWKSTGFDFELTESPYIPTMDPPITFFAANIASITGDFKIAVADMNGDYLDDIVSINNGQVQIHYQQQNGTFTNSIYPVTTQFLPNWSMAIGDIDKNGFNDIVLGGGQGVTFLYANETGTGFTSVSGNEYVFSQRTNFVDLNNDGHLDAFVCHDVDPNVYYLNDGTGALTFHQGGIGDHPEGGNYGSIWVDYDNDGDLDLFIAKCRGGESTAKINELHRNDGNGEFTNVSTESNMADPIQTWSAAWNDYDNDGFMDGFIGASSFSDGKHKLMYNNGDGTFTDTTSVTGFLLNQHTSTEWISYDFDNDGFADIMGGGPYINFNLGGLSFIEVQYLCQIGAIGDLNNDGFLDVQNGNTIYFNSGNSNNWLKINLKGVASNINGIGARVELYSNGVRQIRDVRSGEGFKHMHTLNVHFGIGQNTEIDSVLVKWPSGAVDIVVNPTINSSVLVVEGSNPLSILAVDGKKVTLYPNPTSNELYLQNLDANEVKMVSIFNVQGQEVMQHALEQNGAIDVSKMNNGMYVLQVELKDGKRYSETFIKK